MMNPVLIVTHNCFDLVQKCIASVESQDIDAWAHVVDNDSSEEEWRWIKDHSRGSVHFSPQIGVSAGWNTGLKHLFENEGAEHVLVINQDAFLPPFFYRTLLSYDVPFVTGISVGTMQEIAQEPAEWPTKTLAEAPDFSAFLIRREAWQKIGSFDDSMMLYASDLDFHIRAWTAGIHLWNCGCPFFHERSSTLNTASPKEKRWIQLRADADRAVFQKKWGCTAWGPEYAAMFKPELFGIDA